MFSEFKSSSAADWKNQIIKDLKGEPYESLIWHNENGCDIQPFYTSEDLKQIYEPAFTHADWDICVNAVPGNTATNTNAFLLKNLNRGASSISLNTIGVDLDKALHNIQLNVIQSTFFTDPEKAAELKKYFEKHDGSTALQASLFPQDFSKSTDLQEWSKVISLFKNKPEIRTISVDVTSFHNQNCHATYELALIFSMLVEYLERLSENEEFPSSTIVIKTGVSSDFFVQIAKLRAIRRLWTLFQKEYNINNKLHLIVETSLCNKSASDSYTNLVRTTVEAMAAVAGGCNELLVNEFDVLLERDRELSQRMAINQQLILKDEAYLNKMADIACGSYYLESITDVFAAKALHTFKRFETEGGFFKCLEKKIIAKEIAAQAAQKRDLIENQTDLIIGINKYRNENEKTSLSEAALKALTALPLNNPVLQFELKHIFS
ncbi:MAG: methylmalonyl-CoA mutase family protein [bacterium]|nr:methylmalonyl-CoA mutase family protein [bacterium]